MRLPRLSSGGPRVTVPGTSGDDMNLETVFTLDTSSIKYGPGVTGEVGYDVARLGARRVMVLNAPAVFRFTAPSNPRRHLEAAELMGVDTAGAGPEDAGDLLSEAIVALVRRLGLPERPVGGRVWGGGRAAPRGWHAPSAPSHEAVPAHLRRGGAVPPLSGVHALVVAAIPKTLAPSLRNITL